MSIRVIFLVVGIMVLLAQSCKKNKSVTPSTPPPDPVAASVYQAGLAGTWIATGWGGSYYSPGYSKGDAFFSFKVTVVNDTQIVGMRGDILTLKSIDSIERTAIYTYHWTSFYQWSNEQLIYNYANESIVDTFEISNISSGGYGSTGERFVSAKKSKITSTIATAIAGIAGSQVLSGVGSDFFQPRVPPDSLYTYSGTVHFDLLNDSTISVSPAFFDKDTILHFKTIDMHAQTLIMEDFHYFGDYTRVTYNYGTGAIIFTQEDSSYGIGKHLRLTN
ncbi:MAG: hypothetical protein V4649_00205 [Bacteroidota bacterium]